MATLDDLIAVPELGLRMLVRARLDRGVRWVATSELVDPSPYLEGGELLLTTGLVPQEWGRYAERIAAAGVVGLGFGVGLSHGAVPAELVRAAEAVELPLVEVPRATPFIAITKAVARLVAEEEQASTARALALQQELTRAITGRSGVRGVLRILGRAADGEAGLVDGDGRPVAPARFSLSTSAREAVAILRDGRRRGAVTESGAAGTLVVQPLGPAADGLFLVLTTPRSIDEVLRAGLVTTAALLSLDADRARATTAAELRLRDCAARLALEGSVDAAAGVARLLTGGPALPRRIRVLRLADVDDAVRGQLARAWPAVLTTETSAGGLAAVADADDAAGLAAEAVRLGCRVGTGPAVAPPQAASSDTAARVALDATDAGTPAIRWEDRYRGQVRAGLTDDAAQALAPAILGRLVGEPELLATLRSYLNHLGRWQPTAAELGVHRNTLRKRMSRIEQLTGRRVDTAADRADLWIALTITEEGA